MDAQHDAGEAEGISARPIIETLPVGALEANCYVLVCPSTRQALIIDPGAEGERILQAVAAHGAQVAYIVHTHGHFDHISATESVIGGLPERVPVAAHPADRYLYEPVARAMGRLYGYAPPETPLMPDVALSDGDEVRVGELRLRVVHTPGHTPGSVSLVCAPYCVFSGDTLFHRGIGRTDLPGGDEDAIYESILTRLYVLPGDLTVYAGHGPSTSIIDERRANPFVQAEAPGDRS